MQKALAAEGGGSVAQVNVESNVQTEVARLEQRHRALEGRLTELMRHVSLSPAEQHERARLKKEKLWVKDRLRALDSPLR